MADFNSSLPVRTEAAGDVSVKLVDGTVTSQALSVDSSGRLTVKLQDGSGNALTSTGGDLDVNITNASLVVSATNLDIRDLSHSQDSVKVGDGTDFLAIAADGSIAVTFAAGAEIKITDGTDDLAINGDGSINAVVSATDLDIRNLSHSQDSVKVGDGTDFLAVNADGSLLVNLRDESGSAFSSSNPLPVYQVESDGDEINNYNTSASLAGGGTSNHDYTVSASRTLKLTQINVSGSGKIKAEIQIETSAGSGTYTTRFVFFNSTANPNIQHILKEPIDVATGVKVRVARTNRDGSAQDVYSTISGHEMA